jgi:hypothetical protein
MEFKNRSASHVEEVIALIAHARIPGKLVGVVRHGSCFTIKTK